MDESSGYNNKNIRDFYVNKIRDELDYIHDMEDIDLYLYFNTLNKLDKKIYKEVKNKTKRDVLSLKLIVLKDRLKDKKSLNHLEYTSEYAIELLKENVDNYNLLEKYSKLCTSNYKVVDEGMYLEYARYCDDFNNMANNLVDEIKYRPSNSSLIASLMSTESLEAHLRTNNDEVINDMRNIISENKTLKK